MYYHPPPLKVELSMGIKLPTPPEQDTDSCLGKNRKPLLKFFMRNQNSPLNTILIVVLAKKGAVKLPTPSEQETSFKKMEML